MHKAEATLEVEERATLRDETQTAMKRTFQWLKGMAAPQLYRFVDKKKTVRYADVLSVLRAAMGMQAVSEVMVATSEPEDRSKAVASRLIDAMDDRALLSSLDRVGGTIMRTRVDGYQVWVHTRANTPERERLTHPDLRDLLAQVRAKYDSSMAEQHPNGC